MGNSKPEKSVKAEEAPPPDAAPGIGSRPPKGGNKTPRPTDRMIRGLLGPKTRPLANAEATLLRSLSEGPRPLPELRRASGMTVVRIDRALKLLQIRGLVVKRIKVGKASYLLTDYGKQLVSLLPPAARRNNPPLPGASTPSPIDPSLLQDVAGFVDDAEGWFLAPNPEFEGRSPIELLGTPEESRLRNRIEAAKLGMFS
jgi:Antitoxin Xre/MbcA/ParS C-terminal toxin-binding domain